MNAGWWFLQRKMEQKIDPVDTREIVKNKMKATWFYTVLCLTGGWKSNGGNVLSVLPRIIYKRSPTLLQNFNVNKSPCQKI